MGRGSVSNDSVFLFRALARLIRSQSEVTKSNQLKQNKGKYNRRENEKREEVQSNQALTPHQFRHLAAKLYLDQHPGNYEVVRRVLGHKSIKTTVNFYTGLETRAAVAHFDETVCGLRSAHAPTGRGSRS